MWWGLAKIGDFHVRARQVSPRACDTRRWCMWLRHNIMNVSSVEEVPPRGRRSGTVEEGATTVHILHLSHVAALPHLTIDHNRYNLLGDTPPPLSRPKG